MHDRQRTKKNVKFYDFDLFKLPIKDTPHVIFFENEKPVVVDRQQNSMRTLVKSCEIVIEKENSFSNDQLILMDLFSKGLYYENITKYENFTNFFRSLRSARKNKQEKGREFGYILRNAIDGKIGKIEILPDGSLIPSPPEPLTKDEIDNL